MSADSPGFSGMHVAAFESRRSDEMVRLIERHGGQPHVSASMREVPLDDQHVAIDFANRLIIGEVDVVIFMTGVGFRHLLLAIERHVDRERFLATLSDITTLASGPKPVAAMREVGITPTYKVSAPNTWREVLHTVDEHLVIANQTIVIQEYGQTNASLIAGLEARGGRVHNIQVYRWELPDDQTELEQNVRALSQKEIDVVLFTSANQIVNLFEVARRMGCVAATRAGLQAAVIASIGPTTSEMLRQEELPVDLEPSHAKMGHLVQEAARKSPNLLKRKVQFRLSMAETVADSNTDQASYNDSPFMKACRGEPTDFTPIWLMRQAGRYMPEYRAIREKKSFLDLCKDPDLCSEIMITAVKRLGVDAAIIFSDLLPILEPMGLDLEYGSGEGPMIHNPVRQASDVDRVFELESLDTLHFVTETVRQTRRDLSTSIPLIGFAGAPFTLASYMIEGGASRNYLNTKTLMYRDKGAWQALMERLVRAITLYLNAQIAAGVQCVQLFDSWVGCLGSEDYRYYILPHMQEIIRGVQQGVPVISFATGNPALLPWIAEGGSAVVGVDWRMRLDDAWHVVGADRAIQGNLDPAVLLADRSEIRRRAKDLLDQAAGRPGHIFNLGHGVLQQTPVDNVVALIEMVHEISQRKGID